ncbi:ion channel protein [Microbacterium fluvii]|uniref:Ion channel protein n=1 Tax=Microbacterium fluvii TaxID=415215 RepID=A0ABW2HDQ6_9MICO|nr:ion channel protein [Microbacterium fluvii]MCU4672833.1 ion channel protein [Microbacterium fluvii]
MTAAEATTEGPGVRAMLIASVPALLIGAGSALVLWVIDMLAHGLQHWLWDTLPAQFGASSTTPWWIFVVLTAVGLLVGAVVQFAPGRGGVDSATVELNAPPPPILAVPSIVIAVTLSLAGGVSLGPENPIIAINSALAVTLLAGMSKVLPPQLVILLAISGTIGALFATPVAAALVLTGTVGAMRGPGSLWDKLFLPLAAAGAGAVTMHLLGGESIAFTLEPMGEIQPMYLVLGFVVAAASAGVGILAAWLFPYLHRAFHSLKHPIVFTTLGGAVLGVLGIIGGPLTLFKGLNETGELLTHPDAYSAGQLALFAGVKVVALLVAASAGFRGGRIFPAVFIGTALGLLGYALIPGIPIALAVACGVMGITLAATKDGWMAMFIGVVLVGDVTVLALLCIIVLPVWLLVTKAPELVVHPAPHEKAQVAS